MWVKIKFSQSEINDTKPYRENGLNVLVEPKAQKHAREKRRFFINVLLSIISTVAAVAAAIFAALTYINS